MFGSNVFGSTSFGGNTSFGMGFGSTQQPIQTQAPVGTVVRFVALSGTDTVQKAGSSTGPSQITTRHQNICAMKEYESKSMDELRLEDYAANRKVGQATTTSPFTASSPFGANQAASSPFKTNLFATPTSNSGSLFSGNNTLTSGSPGFFGAQQPKPSTSLFGTNTATQPATGLFGQQNTSTSSNIFGNTSSIFGNTSNICNNTSSIFGSTSNAAATSNTTTQPTASSPFTTGFNATASTSTVQPSTNLFGSAPQNTTSSPFGANQAANSPFKTNLFATPTSNSGSLFSGNNTLTSGSPGFFGAQQPKPSTSLFGTNTATQPATGLFGQQNTSTSSNIFGNTSSIFGSTSNAAATSNTTTQPAAGSLFTTGFNATANTSNVQPSTNLFGTAPQNTTSSPFGTTQTASSPFKSNLFASPTSNPPSFFNSNNSLTSGSTSLFGLQQSQPFGATQTTTSPIGSNLFPTSPSNTGSPFANSPDLLLNRLKTLPYGDSSLLINDSASNAASTSFKFNNQKSTDQYKLGSKGSLKLPATETKSVGSILFDGLDDTTPDDVRCAIDIFVPKRNIKKLDIKPNSSNVDNDNSFNTNSSVSEISRAHRQSASP